MELLSNRKIFGDKMQFFKKILRLTALPIYYGLITYLPKDRFFQNSKKIREVFAKMILDECGSDVWIDDRVYFGNGQNRTLGKNSGLGSRAYIGRYTSIGEDVMMGPNVTILTHNHRFDSISIPMRLQGFEEYKPVTIEDDVWVGQQVIILPGTHIGRGSIIGAGSVVTKDVEPYSIVGGNPAKLIRMRK